MITDMNEPLGCAVGNALEVKEAIETLRGRGPEDLTELCLRGGGVILAEAGLAADEDEGRKRMQQVIDDGSAIEKLKEMVSVQGGNTEWIENTELFTKSRYMTPFTAERNGYIQRVRALEIGKLAMEIGAGRERKEDTIQPETGIVLGKKTGDKVSKGDVLAWVHHNRPLDEAWKKRLDGAFMWSEKAVPPRQLIYKII